jgi:hypothetical protein
MNMDGTAVVSGEFLVAKESSLSQVSNCWLVPPAALAIHLSQDRPN